MRVDKSKPVVQIPSFARPETYNFEATPESFKMYQELSQISEEIEKCRLANS